MRTAEFTDDQILEAIDLVAEDRRGRKVTASAVRGKLGGGSHDRIKKVLTKWEAEKEGQEEGASEEDVLERVAAKAAEDAMASVIANAVKGQGNSIVGPVVEVVRKELSQENAALRSRTDKAEKGKIKAESDAAAARRNEDALRKEIEELRVRLEKAQDQKHDLSGQLDRMRAKKSDLEKKVRDQNELVTSNRDLQRQNTSLANALYDIKEGLVIGDWADTVLGLMRHRQKPGCALTVKEWNEKGQAGILESEDGADKITLESTDLNIFGGLKGATERYVIFEKVESGEGEFSLYKLHDDVIAQAIAYAAFRRKFDMMMVNTNGLGLSLKETDINRKKRRLQSQ